MRVIIVGNSRERQDLREQLETTEPDVVGEFGSLVEARNADIAADAFILSAGSAQTDLDDSAEIPAGDLLVDRRRRVATAIGVAAVRRDAIFRGTRRLS